MWQTWAALLVALLRFVVIPVALVVCRISIWTFWRDTYPLSVRYSTSTLLAAHSPLLPFTPVWFFCCIISCVMFVHFVDDCSGYLDNTVHYTSFLHMHYHGTSCNRDVDILMVYTSSFCTIFHHHISCYTRSISPIHPSMVFLQRTDTQITTQTFMVCVLFSKPGQQCSLHFFSS